MIVSFGMFVMSRMWKVRDAAFARWWKDVISWCSGCQGRLGKGSFGGGEAVAAMYQWLVGMVASFRCIYCMTCRLFKLRGRA